MGRLTAIVLGSAGGGGYPQWNCLCPACRLAWGGDKRAKPRTQASLAVSGDGESWTLINASPDLRAQIEATPQLPPRRENAGVRQSPIAGVVLANADLDHTLGLLLLRELQPFRIYATPSVRAILREDNSMFAMLERAPNQVTWTSLTPGAIFELLYPLNNDPAGHRAGLTRAAVATRLGTATEAVAADRHDRDHGREGARHQRTEDRQ